MNKIFRAFILFLVLTKYLIGSEARSVSNVFPNPSVFTNTSDTTNNISIDETRNRFPELLRDSKLLMAEVIVSDFNKDIKVFEDVLPKADALGELVLTLDLQEPEDLEIKYLRGEGHWRRAD